MKKNRCIKSLIHFTLFLSMLLLAAGPSSPVQAGSGIALDSTRAENPAFIGSGTIASLSFTALTSGMAHTCGLTSAGGVKCWGSNGLHQIGDGTDYPNRGFAWDVSGLGSGVIAIAAGEDHTCAIMVSDGSLLQCWGEADAGALGTYYQSHPPTIPVGINLPDSVTALAAGSSFTCAIVLGAVYCWGQNAYGQSGSTDFDHIVDPPAVVAGLSSVTAIAAGSSHACALVSGGVKCWGNNDAGQLGDGTTKSQSTVPVTVTNLSGVTAISASGDHTCALLTSGGIKCWGGNWDGELGIGSTTNSNVPVGVIGLSSGVLAISAGENHTCALLTGGGMRCWGDNEYGQLGDGTLIERLIPVNVNGLAGSVSAITAGGYHTCALISGAAKCWGDNEDGQLGEGVILMHGTPIYLPTFETGGVTALALGAYHSCAVVSGGVQCWGSNSNGQLGDGTTTDHSLPVNVVGLSSGSGVTAISAASSHSCAVKNGTVECWGVDSHGDDTLTPAVVGGLPAGVTAVGSGESYSCALASGGVWCWGNNDYGQLGNGTTDSSDTPVPVNSLSSGVTAIGVGESHACAVKGGDVYCWGDNWSGDLGNNTEDQSNTPVDLHLSGATIVTAGEDSSCALVSGGVKCWGMDTGNNPGNQSDIPVDVVGLTSNMTSVAAGTNHTCGLATDGSAYCWGNNYLAQLGDGTRTNSNIPVPVGAVGIGAPVSSIAIGDYHTCAIIDAGKLVCWGGDNQGQVGLGTAIMSLTPASVGETTVINLNLNYPDGQAGSFFTVSGSGFSPDTQIAGTTTPIPIFLNGIQVFVNLTVNQDGNFLFILGTSGAGNGTYILTIGDPPLATTSFYLAYAEPLRAQESEGPPIITPGWTSVIPYPVLSFIYLPMVGR